ncbi:MAG: hypothetical protein Q8O72_09505 [Bacteroidales bacterium]|nr:hypothetical protein [Bacteroidales bacterium]
MNTTKILFLLKLLAIVLMAEMVTAQSSNMKFERVRVGDAKQILCGLDLAPDHSYLAISSIQSFPFYQFNFENKNVIQQFDVGNWYAGSTVRHSADGKFVLLQQLFYLDFSLNKDREVDFDIIHAATGQKIVHFEKCHAVTITPDSEHAISISGNEITIWKLPSGEKIRSFILNQATNGLAVSPDGKYLAVSHKPNEKELKKEPYYKKNKRALKAALKYKNQISVYDIESFSLQYTVNSLYDIIYRLEYSPDGNTLFCLQIPHIKVQSSKSGRQSYISTINGKTGEPQRKGFTSQASYEPEFKLSPDGKLFGMVSRNGRFTELQLFDFETGRIKDRFEESYRLFEKTEVGMTMGDGRMSFAFLPDNKTLVMTMGNHLIFWEPKL